MADAARILDRVRTFGADIIADETGIRVVRGNKLPADAIAYIKANRASIVEYLQEEKQDAFDERAAIIEFDAGVPREWAHQFAKILVANRPAHVERSDWAWFLNTCGKIIDTYPGRSS